MANRISYHYQLEQSISVLRDVGWYFSFYSSLNKTILQANSEDPDQMPLSAASDLGLHYLPRCPTKRMLGLYGLMQKNMTVFLLNK